jgi:cell division protein FtsB
MNIIGKDGFDQDALKHYNHVVDVLDQNQDSGKSRSRIRVGRVDDKEFIEPEKSKKKSSKKKSELTFSWKSFKSFSKLTWFLTIILFLGIVRLFLMDQGVVNYLQKKGSLNERLALIDQIKQENISLMKEIKRANEDIRYQKNLAREQLGVISAEEYLILFAPKKLTPSN